MSRKASALVLWVALAVLAGGAPSWAASVLPRRGAELQVNVKSQGNQHAPAVASVPSGGLVAVWQDDSPGGVRARLFSSDGKPLSGEIQVTTGTVASGPRVAAGNEELVVVWSDFQFVYLRRFGLDGQPLGNTQQVSQATSSFASGSPDVATEPGGASFRVVWVENRGSQNLIFTQRLAAGVLEGNPVRIDPGLGRRLTEPRVVVGQDASYFVVWNDFTMNDIGARRFDAPSGLLSPEVRVDRPADILPFSPEVVLYGDGTAAVVWNELNNGISVQRLDAQGALLGGPVQVAAFSTELSPLAAVVDEGGNMLVAWTSFDDDPRIQVRLLDPSLNPLTPAFPLSDGLYSEGEPVLVKSGGGFAALWTSGFADPTPPSFPIPIPFPLPTGKDGAGGGIFLQRFAPSHCAQGSAILCLGPEGRFEARVAWKNPFNGAQGVGRTVPLTTDTGAFWFFAEENLEILLKVLDARAVNENFWVYYGSLSNVEYTVTVTDTQTGAVKSYINRAFELASRADTQAFHDEPISGSLPASAEETILAGPAEAQLTGEPCEAGDDILCLGGGRFEVEVDFTDPRTGASGRGNALPLTADTGSFWFFGADNLELMVKVLDARVVNGHFWVYTGGLSDVAYTVTITDRETGQSKEYRNPGGRLASQADVDAF